jgi:dolichol-phosphate mannosyltransferase
LPQADTASIRWEDAGEKDTLSIVIPARDEEGCLVETVTELVTALKTADITHEILVVDDGSTDSTLDLLAELHLNLPTVKYISNTPPHGFGLAVRKGLQNFRGDAVAIMMADGSDDPQDLIKYYRKLCEGYDCVFGSRFISGGKVSDYPAIKLVLNRIVNSFIRILFGFKYNDVTNAFKCFRRPVIAGLRPLLSHHFNLTVELPLKAIIRGYRYTILPNSWKNREAGVSKLKIQEMGSRYLFIILYCFIEKFLSRGDYVRKQPISMLPSDRVDTVSKSKEAEL